MTRTNALVAALSLCTALYTQSGTASLIVSGDFLVPFAGTPVGILQGSFTAEFDDDHLTGVGFERFTDLPILTEFSLSPNPLNVTRFTTANTGIELTFNDGVLTGVVVGGLADVSFSGDGPDDFWVRYSNGVSNLTSVNYDGTRYGAVSDQGRYRVTSVVEPGHMVLLSLGLAALALRRKVR